MKPTIVFDVNETLLDLAPVGRWFDERFNGQPSAAMWFRELLRLSFVSSTTDRYTPFPSLAGPALATVAADVGASAPSAMDLADIGAILERLPTHPDVPAGLAKLSGAGFSVAALTNSPHATAVRQLTNAGIAESFDDVMSVEMVPRFKPHRSVYLAAAEHLGRTPAELIMVAAHDWDIAGALAAGLSGVFVGRKGQQYSDGFPSPTAVVDGIEGAAHWIVERYGTQGQ
jgi:2-haloacid dehalogenase